MGARPTVADWLETPALPVSQEGVSGVRPGLTIPVFLDIEAVLSLREKLVSSN